MKKFYARLSYCSTCEKCGSKTFLRYNNENLCKKCLETELREEVIYKREKINCYKVSYTDRHMEILMLSRQNKQTLKDIQTQNSELLNLLDELDRLKGEK